MKKKSLICLTALFVVFATLLTGCGKADYDFENNDLSAYITLPADLKDRDFKEGLSLKAEPTEKDIQAKIDEALKGLAEVVDLDENATVEDGDELVIDYVGKYKADGKNSDGTEYKAGDAFSGGTATDSKHTVDLENSTFIDGFDKGMIGMKAGETKDIDMAFPTPYENNPDLAGVEVTFTVTVDSISRTKLPELTDELVKANPEDFESMATAAEYKEHVKEHLEEETVDENNKKIINTAWKYILDNSTYSGNYPDGLLDKYIKTYLDYYEHTVAAQDNLHLKEYVKKNGHESVEAFKTAVVIPEAETALKEKLALYATAKLLGITVTADDIKTKAQEDYKSNIEPNLALYKAYFGIASFTDYYKSVKNDASVKEGMIFDRTFEALCGIKAD